MSLKPSVHKVKDLRGRKIVGYRAQLGSIDSTIQPTAAKAIEECYQLVREAIERLAQGPKIKHWRGHLIVVTPRLYALGWSYWIDTFSTGNDSGSNYPDSIAAYNSAIYHLAQSLWSADSDDHELISAVPSVKDRAELAGWIGFQRAYISIRSAGEVSEIDTHRAACEQGHAYAREHFAAYLHRAATEAR